jgi:hypothetical protein
MYYLAQITYLKPKKNSLLSLSVCVLTVRLQNKHKRCFHSFHSPMNTKQTLCFMHCDFEFQPFGMQQTYSAQTNASIPERNLWYSFPFSSKMVAI